MNPLTQITPCSRRLLALALVAFVSTAAYVNTLRHGFVYDDTMQILQDPWIRDFAHIPEIFSNSVWGFHSGGASNYYRPLMNLIFLGAYQLSGLQPWAYHLVNILLHVGSSLLVFLVLERLYPRTTPRGAVPLVSALLFAAHPIHTEVVAWACGVTDTSYTFFLLLAWLLYLSSNQDLKTWRFMASLAAFFSALLCKEPAIVLPGILLASDYAFGKREETIAVLLRRQVPYMLVAAVYFLLRYAALGGFFAVLPQREFGPFTVLLNAAVLFSRYLGKLILPTGLSAYHTFVPVASLLETRAVVASIFALAFLVLCFACLRRNRALFLALVLTALPLFPVLHMPSLGTSALAERYLYLPSVGFVLVLSLSLEWIRSRFPRVRMASGIAVVVLAATYLFMTSSRNAVWESNLTLFSDMARKYPKDEFPLTNLAEALWESGRHDESITLLRRIVAEVNPHSDRAFYSLGASLQVEGNPEEAIGAYKKSLDLNKTSYFAHYAHFNIGTLSFRLGRLDDAVRHLRVAVKLQPNNWTYHAMLGNVLGSSGLYDDAIREFETAARIAPQEPLLRSSSQRALTLKTGGASNKPGVPGSSPR